MFPITLHVQLLYHYGYRFSNFNGFFLVTYLVTFRGHLLIINGILHYCILELPVLWHFPPSF